MGTLIRRVERRGDRVLLYPPKATRGRKAEPLDATCVTIMGLVTGAYTQYRVCRLEAGRRVGREIPEGLAVKPDGPIECLPLRDAEADGVVVQVLQVRCGDTAAGAAGARGLSVGGRQMTA
jgi:hypothetical protein